MAYTQNDKLIAIGTPLGKDVLLLDSFKGEEGLSRLFNFELTMVSENRAIAFDAIVGQNVTVGIVLADGKQRYINGIISSFSQGGGRGEQEGTPWFSCYRATMVPWFWVLTKTTDSRIFQNLSVPDIVQKVFQDQGFSDFKLSLHGTYDKREYCVQYQETDYNFVSRLLEDEGIFYFFEHENGKHTMVLADSPAEHKPCPGQKSVSYELITGGLREEDAITSLELTQQLRAARYTLKDFNFKVPNTNLKVEVKSQTQLGPGNRELYDYPGNYEKKSVGETLAKIRIEEEEAQSIKLYGASYCRSFSCGFHFNLKDHYRRDLNKKYVLVSVRHEATDGYGVDAKQEYRNTFECIPHSVPYRPPRLATKPMVRGTQTAIVVGPSGEDIYTDEHGRVKVQFHWDREGKADDKSSCFIRVSQSWAGNGWGGMQIPRKGHEVIVDFIEGDPDRPIIIGNVYHGTNVPPYKLPDHKTKSTLKSSTSKGGAGFNEIRFEDDKGNEQVFIHGEKNLDVRVKKDALEWIGNERHLIVIKDQLEKVDGDKHLTVTGDQNEKIDGTVSLKTGQDLQQKIGAKHALDAGQEIHLKAGMNVVIEAGMSITLKAGGGFIVVGPAGVTISGTPVLINSGGSAGSGSGASPDPPKAPKEADKADPGKVSSVSDQSSTSSPPPPISSTKLSPQAAALKSAAESGAPFCDT